MYNKVAEQIKNISAPIHEKIVSKFNKIDFDTIDVEEVWEVIYLIMLAFYVGVNVLTSTMFEIAWPAYFFQTFRSICVTLVIIRLIIIKEIPKKKFIAMVVISFVFLMSHYMSGYGLPIDLLILVLGAYNVDFRKILKTYIAVWSVLLVITIIGAMTGLAENLVYYQGTRVRMALGICYPTDLAAYVAYLMITFLCVREKYISYIEIGGMFALAIITFYITDARTDFAVMLLLIILVLIVKIFENKVDLLMKKGNKVVVCIPILFCLISWIVTAAFNETNEFLVRLDQGFLSNRLSLGKNAIDNYGIRMFGQYIIEHGLGGSLEWPEFYNFIDCSYISIAIKYGIVILVTIFIFIIVSICRAYKEKRYMIVLAILIVCLQSIMEHHLIQYWYNPLIITVFSCWRVRDEIKLDDQMIVDLN